MVVPGNATLGPLGNAGFARADLLDGTHTLTVTYVGDTNHTGSVSAGSDQLVGRRTSRQRGRTLPSGAVTFFANGGNFLGFGIIDGSGNTSLSTSALDSGTQTITATRATATTTRRRLTR